MFAQVNVVLETLKVTGLQLSVLLLSTLAAVMLAVPPTNVIVTGLQLAIGAVLSRTVMTCILLDELPQASIAVHLRVSV
jgi:hypothetical protein